MSAKRREDVIYDHAEIKLNLQRKASIPGFAQASNREHTWGNLYRHPVRDVSPDYNGSSMKIQEQALRMSPKKKSFVDLHKQGPRDCMQHMKTNEFYRNVET